MAMEALTQPSGSFGVDAKKLRAALALIKPTVNVKHAFPTLACVRVESRKREIVLTGTNLEIAAQSSVDCATWGAWTALIPLRALTDAVKGAKGTVRFEQLSPNRVRVTASGAVREISTLSPDDYPVVIGPHGKASAEAQSPVHVSSILAGELTRLLKRVSYAASIDWTRPHLCSVNIECSNYSAKFSTTDGHRAAVARADVTRSERQGWSALIPSSAIPCLEKLSGPVDAYLSSDLAWFETATSWVSCKLVDGAFPRLDYVIPQHGRPLRVNRLELLAAVKSCALKGSKSMTFDVANAQVTLSCEFEGDRASGLCSAEWNEQPFSIGFHPRYVIELLESIDDEEIQIQLDDALEPLCIRTSDGTTAVCMPTRL